ncbi:hypothetical protein D9613_006239 [Agrocybe pediades]|uniref:Uncharacterized protein n=1 Tax=Agrocybe pediades TaxID=84607 RepID=A0A8H4QUQ6_9AGAR|nr:hypothetical protein D9613_006239 [Agrocybe pediades]
MSSTHQGISGYMKNGKTSVLDALLPFMHRCEDLFLIGEHQPFMELLSPETLTALRIVKIAPIKGGDSKRTWQPLAKLMAAPKLESFSCLSRSTSDISIADIPFHLSPHLTCLLLESVKTPYQDVLATLQNLPKLEFLSIEFRRSSFANATTPSVDTVSLPHLGVLIIYDYANPSETATFFNCLTNVPRLWLLGYQTMSQSLSCIDDQALRQDAIINGFSFAGYTLITKKVDGRNFRHFNIPLNLNRDQVLQCFRMLPYLEELDLNNVYEKQEKAIELFDLEPLIVQPNVPVLLPRLRFISIQNSRYITDEVVLRFIISRIQALPCSDTSDGQVVLLKSFEGWFLRQKQQDIVPAVKQYANDAGIQGVHDIELKFTYMPDFY